jgi:hypothetical protein
VLAGHKVPVEPAPTLTLVIPVFDETHRLPLAFPRLQAAVDEGSINPACTQVIVVDDGSTDNPGPLIRELFTGFPMLELETLRVNTGKGAAVKVGVAKALAPITVFMDADMAIDPRQIPMLVDALEMSELSIGSRLRLSSEENHGDLRRTIMSKAFNGMVNLVTHVSLDDTQCGFKGFRTPVARLLFDLTSVRRFAFDVDLVAMARQFGFRISQVPVEWTHDTKGSNIRPLLDPLSMIKDVLFANGTIKRAHPVPAIMIPVAASSDRPSVADVVGQLVGATLPILPTHPQGVGVLLPSCGSIQIDRILAMLMNALPQREPYRITALASDLRDLAPLKLWSP